MKLEKLTTLLVDEIEPCLTAWKALGYELTVRVPDEGRLDFVILGSCTATDPGAFAATLS